MARFSLVAILTLCAAGSRGICESPSNDYRARVAALQQSRQEHPQDIQVLDALAGSYTMAGEYRKAIAVVEEMRRLRPRDADLQLRLARNQAWAGRTARAIDTYQAYLVARPQDRQAAMELIRLWRYRGEYERAERLANTLLARHPEDAEVLALKAEVLHWAGNRKRLAHRTAEHAARLDADSPDAKVARIYALRDLGQNRQALEEFETLRDQVARRGGPPTDATYRDAYRLLDSELAPPAPLSATPVYSVYNDSDGIHNLFSGLRLRAPLRNDHALILDLSHWRSSAPLASVFTAGRRESFASEFAAGGIFRAGPAVHVTLLGGGSRRATGNALRPTFDFQIAASPFDRWTFDFSTGREFLKVTPRAIDSDISSYKLAGGAQYALDSRTSLAAGATRRYWSDNNRSIAGQVTFRRVLHYYKPFMVDAGAFTHWEKFDRDTKFQSGFFTPDRYLRHDGFLGLHGELGRAVLYELRGTAGFQQVARAASYRSDWEIVSSVSVRVTRALRLSANYQRRNYSLLSRDGWYQGFYVSLGVQP